MGAIGGMLGFDGGAGGTGFQGPEQSRDQTGMNNLQNTYQQLQQVSSGAGPNPAMAQYNQNIQNLAHQQSGAISSVQGISPALAARLISQQSSAAMQNAAAGGAKTQAEQQLAALGQQGTVANAQAQNSIQAQNNINTVNGGLAGSRMGQQGDMMGGIMQGAGMAMAMADGGAVAAPAASQGPVSQFAQFLKGAVGVAPSSPADEKNAPPQNQSQLKTGSAGFAKGIGGLLKGGASSGAMAGGAGDISPMAGAGAMFAAQGGRVPAMVSPGELWLPPQKVQMVARGKNPLEIGERIPGSPKVSGNSYANDVVPKNLDVGGVVIPNSIMQSKDPAKASAAFVAKIIAKRRGKK